MSQTERTSRIAVLLFTDMVESVALQEHLGNEAYALVLRQHHQLFNSALRTVGAGNIYQDTGDGFLAEFSNATDAVNVALLFQHLIRTANWAAKAPLIRIGIHQGQLSEVLIDDKSAAKIVGMPVNVAARVMSLALPGQILMTHSVYDDARQFVRAHPGSRSAGPDLPAVDWKLHGDYEFKGSHDAMDVIEVGAVGFAPFKPPPDSEKARRKPRLSELAMGAIITAMVGLALWWLPLGQPLVNASYDYLFRFGSRTITNQVALVLMDNAAYSNEELKTEFGVARPGWNRALYARLVNRLANDGCQLAVFDITFRTNGNVADPALAAALHRLPNVVLGAVWSEDAEQGDQLHEGRDQTMATPPVEPFLSAVGSNNWGVTYVGLPVTDRDLIVRRQWPFPNPGSTPTLSWTAALRAGAKLNGDVPEERWLRYYDIDRAWTKLSYPRALTMASNFFRDKIVFVGNWPESTIPNSEHDQFQPPHIRWGHETMGGVVIHATSFLNLINQDWLRRPHWLIEGLMFVVTGAALGIALGRSWGRQRFVVALSAAVACSIGAILLSHYTNYWFPWMVLPAGQIPCALLWAVFPGRSRMLARRSAAKAPTGRAPSPTPRPATLIEPAGVPARREPVISETETPTRVEAPTPMGAEHKPEVPEYALMEPYIGKGAFGKVWLARSAINQWQAVKAVYQSTFGANKKPYETEYHGLGKYKRVSEKHPGLLRIELVSKMKPEGYFYYVMELGDAQEPGWEENPASYRPRNLEIVRSRADGGRLPVETCLEIVTVLADALKFLHAEGFVHRDIKPSNVIFVNKLPKLADIGLVANIRPVEQISTVVGTPDYMPPAPEVSGTPQADIYALGMLLYVISTGQRPGFFPELSTTLMDRSGHRNFLRLDAIILKACQPDLTKRYQNTGEMLADLREVARVVAAAQDRDRGPTA